ncbi:unnamed protein product [Clonostachys solani]|uniref:Major facilitator superfamily (MFS) profile domain-containing protein n=1 Tax=Clonostachys solani TaxID=160281 RepID=A0A9N9Z7I9_9HYPO|nr:unnamed protein product [Clonostachys solani]
MEAIPHVDVAPPQRPGFSRDLEKVEQESRESSSRSSHLQRLIDQAGVDSQVIAHSYPGHGTSQSPFIVDFLPIDDRNPRAFSSRKKWTIIFLQALSAFIVAFVSTAFSGALPDVVRTFNVSSEVGVLGISLFVLGFAIGPLFWAPLSELFGRQYAFLSTYTALVIFNVGAAVAQNIQTLIILRFLAGTVGSAPLVNAGAAVADLFAPVERGRASILFASAPLLGPSLGPIVSGFLGTRCGWRWVEGLMAILTGVMVVICAFSVPETYSPVLLRRRAQKLSAITGDQYISRFEDRKSQATAKNRFRIALSRPWVMLLREPIVLLSAIYIAFIYGTLYMLFPAFPIIFAQTRGWAPEISALAFLGMTIGMALSIAFLLYDQKRYRALTLATGSAPPESRLPPAMIGACFLPVGLFWFAWTNGPDVAWIVPIIASGVFGAGLVLVFLSLTNYLIDSYAIYAASALAASAFMRSVFGAAFPLFATKMYAGLGIHWASSVPAFLALACLPFPFLFHRYGSWVRSKCAFSAEILAESLT